MLVWPLLVRQPAGETVGPPFVFLLLLPVVIVVVLTEVTEGGVDPRVLAVLGVLSAITAVLRGHLARHGRRRAGVLPADPGRAGVRRRLRLRARLHGAVHLGAPDRRRRPVAALPDALLRLGRDGRRAAAAAGHRARRDRDARRRTACWRRTPTACCSTSRRGRSCSGSPCPGTPGSRSCPATRWPTTCTASWSTRLLTSTGTFDTGRAITNALAIVLLGPAVLASLRRTARRVVVTGAVSGPVVPDSGDPSSGDPADLEKPLPPPPAPPSVEPTDHPSTRKEAAMSPSPAGLRSEAGSRP